MFVRTSHDFGTVKVGVLLEVEFPYTEDIAYISQFKNPCDCSDVSNHPKERKVVVKYRPAPIPPHLKNNGVTQVSIAKVIEVKFNTTDGIGDLTQNLAFTALVTE